jgi:DNA-binding GntR family transcriptional regulator
VIASLPGPRRRQRGKPAADTTRESGSNAHLYALIQDVLSRSITARSLPRGIVVLEGPVAEILGTTRSPVRSALLHLEEQGLVSRFEGRGYVVGPPGTPPQRLPIEPSMLQADGDPPAIRKTRAWETIFEQVEHDLIHAAIFDRYRVNEVELARHFNVGRLAARDVLLRMEGLGIVERDERQRWCVAPFDRQRIGDLYELRILLEPAALRSAYEAGGLDVAPLVADLQRAIKAYPRISAADMDKLERDLHVALLQQCPNRELMQCLQRSRCLLSLGKQLLGAGKSLPRDDPYLGEHLSILEAIASHAPKRAETLLREHLEDSRDKVLKHAETVRRRYERLAVPYIA